MEEKIKLQDIGEKFLEIGNSLKTSKPEVTLQTLAIAFGVGVLLSQMNFRKAVEYGRKGKRVTENPILSSMLPMILRRIFR